MRHDLNSPVPVSSPQGMGLLESFADGHRSVWRRYAGVEGAEPIPEFSGKIVPRKAVLELRKLLDEYPEVELGIDDQNLTVKTVTSRLIFV